MQGNRGKIRHQTLVWLYNNISQTSPEGKVTILRNQQVRTNRTVPKNKPDIIIPDNKKGTCMIIDAVIPGGRNVI